MATPLSCVLAERVVVDRAPTPAARRYSRAMRGVQRATEDSNL